MLGIRGAFLVRVGPPMEKKTLSVDTKSAGQVTSEL